MYFNPQEPKKRFGSNGKQERYKNYDINSITKPQNFKSVTKLDRKYRRWRFNKPNKPEKGGPWH